MESERETGGNTCLDSILSNGDRQAILESMMTCGDPLLAVEAKKRLTALSLSTASLVEELVMSSFRLCDEAANEYYGSLKYLNAIT